MKIRALVGVLCLVLAAVPAVAEDPFCDQLNKILAGTAGGFADLKGEAKSGAATWMAKVSIRGGKECLIIGKDSPSYMCSLYAGDKDEDARSTYEDHVEWIGKCLGDKWQGKESADAQRTEHTFRRGAAEPTVRVRSQIGDGNAYSVEVWVDPAEKPA